MNLVNLYLLFSLTSSLHPMVRPRESREKRLCLACGGSTKVSHLGQDICRACAVFHRRSLTRNYVCRSKTGDCPLQNGRCRKCRFNKIEQMLASTPIVYDCVTNGIENDERQATPLLAKLLECYRSMCDTRLIAELSTRIPPTHPLEMNHTDFIPTPATPSALNNANHIFLSAILKFGEQAFSEFNKFSKAEKWSITTSFFHRFRLFESGFRADEKFPEDLEKSFGSYTMYVSEEVAQSFYEDPNSNRMMALSLKNDLRPNRERFQRLKLQDEEFVAVLALMFWESGNSKFCEVALSVGTRYRTKVLHELHCFYRRGKGLDGYASRLGEILLFLDVYSQLSAQLNHKFELLRLANVFTEDTVLYSTASHVQ